MEASNIVQMVVTKTIPKKKKCKTEKWLPEEASQIAQGRREVKGKEEMEKLYPTECSVIKNSKVRQEGLLKK